MNALRKIMSSIGINQTTLARQLGWEKSKLSRIENWQQDLSETDIREICARLQISSDKLLGIEAPSPPNIVQATFVLTLSPVGVEGWFSPMETDSTVRAAMALRAPIDFGRIRAGDIVLGDPEEPYGPGDIIYVETVDNRAALAVFKGQTGMGMTIERPSGKRSVSETLKHGVVRKIVRILWGSV